MNNFHLWQDGLRVVSVYCDAGRDSAWREIQHYAAVYEQDGPVTIKEGNRIMYRTDSRDPVPPR